MEIQTNPTQVNAPVSAVPQIAPDPAQPDGRATADTAAIAKDPTPQVPLPVPANPTQIGLVSKAAMSEKDAAPSLDASGVSAAERMLKPYGINMLPEKQDAPKQETPPKA